MGIQSSPEFSRRLAERIAAIRKARGTTQSAIAKELGIAQQSFARYEAGQRRFSVNVLPGLADALGVTIDELLGVEPMGRRGRVSRLERRFEAIRQLPRKEQEFILQVLDRILGEK